MAKITLLATATLEVRRLDAWRDFIEVLYGLRLQETGRPGEYEAVVDDAGCRYVFREGPADDLVSMGWIADDLVGLFERIEKAGGKAEWLSESDTAAAGAGRALRTWDPTGLEVVVMDRTASCNPFERSVHGHSFVTGELGLGHVTVSDADLSAFERFYTEALGIGISDYNDVRLAAGVEIHVGFYHANPRHHSIACASLALPRRRLNHFFLEVATKQEVMDGYVRAKQAGIPIAHEIGVHPNDQLFTFYTRSPSGFQCELGTGGVLVEEGHPQKTFKGMSTWGHRMPAGQKVRMIEPVLRAAGRQLKGRFSRGRSAPSH